jgi:hypothetical protein
MSEVKPEIKERIEKAAQALLERGEKPTVDAVRRLAKSSMATPSSSCGSGGWRILWRRCLSPPPCPRP